MCVWILSLLSTKYVFSFVSKSSHVLRKCNPRIDDRHFHSIVVFFLILPIDISCLLALAINSKFSACRKELKFWPHSWGRESWLKWLCGKDSNETFPRHQGFVYMISSFVMSRNCLCLSYSSHCHLYCHLSTKKVCTLFIRTIILVNVHVDLSFFHNEKRKKKCWSIEEFIGIWSLSFLSQTHTHPVVNHVTSVGCNFVVVAFKFEVLNELCVQVTRWLYSTSEQCSMCSSSIVVCRLHSLIETSIKLIGFFSLPLRCVDEWDEPTWRH